jgi:hypothetical protein
MKPPSYSIHYDLVPSPQGVTLRIWEFTPAGTDKEKYLYKLNYKQASEDSAWKRLNQHLKILGSQKISYTQFRPQGGQVTVTPGFC